MKLSEQAKAHGPAAGTAPKLAISDTVARLRVLVGGNVTTREIAAKAGIRAAMTIYNQPAILIGAENEIAYVQSTFEKDNVLSEGVYTFGPDLFELGDFGALKISRNMKLLRVSPLTEDQKKKFAPTKTSIDDFKLA